MSILKSVTDSGRLNGAEHIVDALPFDVLPTGVAGVWSIAPIPDDFDPNTASKKELIKAGLLWRRPEAGDPPAVAEAWRSIFSRKWPQRDQIVPAYLSPRLQPPKRRRRRRSLNEADPYAWS